jgi:hypothetical protein
MPKFQPGQSGNKTGRKPGTKNKINGKVWDICQKWNCNPLEVLCWIATDNLWHEEQRIPIKPQLMMEAAAELSQYCYPKLKSIEHKGDKENPVNFNIILGHHDKN